MQNPISFLQILPVMFSLWFLTAQVHADTIHVPADIPSIQGAIDIALDGDEIVIAPGLYNEAIDLLGKAIIVRSSNPSDPDVVAATIIDANGLNSSVITCSSHEGRETLLDGLTIREGTGTLDTRIHIFNLLGGGLFILNSSPTVRRCTFSNNNADYGGGIYSFLSDVLVESCLFLSNEARLGGGYAFVGGDITIRGCQFMHNNATASGGGVAMFSIPIVRLEDCDFIENTSFSGGGLRLASSVTTITNCRFLGNSANIGGGLTCLPGNSNDLQTTKIIGCTFDGNRAEVVIFGAPILGGGMVLQPSSSHNIEVTNCRIRDNSAEFGGGIYTDSEDAIRGLAIVNCAITGNSAEFGAGLYNDSPDPDPLAIANFPIITNCTISGNSASIAGGAMYNLATPRLANCILWSNGEDEIINDGGMPEISYSLLAGGHPGPGNLDADPMFAGPDDFTLMPGSPAIDAGDSFAIGLDFIMNDLAGAPRLADDPDTPDTGLPDSADLVVDIGAYEFQPLCPGDFFPPAGGDGIVDVSDLLFVVRRGGPSSHGHHFNIVNLLLVITNWGPCP